MASNTLRIAGTTVAPGQRQTLHLALPGLYTGTGMTMPVQVLRGRRDGPRLFVCAALHGDELNGAEIIRRAVDALDLRALRGALIAVPVVNIFGFINQSRYLPDRRDLNRSFPGSASGSLAARIAHLFMTEIVAGSTHGIDLHTGSLNRTNLPQIRANLDEPETRRCALLFGAPVAMHASTRDGSLREAAMRHGIPLLVYEGGEPLRFSEDAIEAGVRGVLRVMAGLGMLKPSRKRRQRSVLEVRRTSWVRARRSGIFHLEAALGETVSKGQSIGFICDTLGGNQTRLPAPANGLVIGHTNTPLVHRGDAIVHLALLDE